MSTRQNKSVALNSLDVDFFKLNLYFSSYFNEFFNRKNIVLTQYNLTRNKNYFHIDLNLYFREKKLIHFKKLSLKRNKKNLNAKTKFIDYLLKDLKNKFRINFITFNLKVLNRLILFSSFFRYLKKKTKFFKKKLFERRHGLYLDVIKLSVLYFTNQVDLEFLLNLIAEIFKRLSKRKHGAFFKFIKILFKNTFLNSKPALFYSKFKGCKFLISGKIRGKLRAKRVSLVLGAIPISTFSKNIDYARVDVNTIYGVFGMTLFVYKNLTVRKNFSKVLKRFFILKKVIKFLRKRKKMFKFKQKYNLLKKRKNARPFKKKKNFSIKKTSTFFNLPPKKKKSPIFEQIKKGIFNFGSIYGLK